MGTWRERQKFSPHLLAELRGKASPSTVQPASLSPGQAIVAMDHTTETIGSEAPLQDRQSKAAQYKQLYKVARSSQAHLLAPSLLSPSFNTRQKSPGALGPQAAHTWGPLTQGAPPTSEHIECQAPAAAGPSRPSPLLKEAVGQ